ncbi:hypothetical protein MJO29_013510 [Puccinia striiformis f. sp. tritici]|uniref:hypothetical protein n=1 Tax=Puccinia striiformis f. sp. tritici TaxID=168172 RepID=UPI002008AF5E|nr:hypothetical protein Pst134EA_025815 [Puccinia striiformis f. sp. tritici]XP_047800177.1 hypothetical protein Pst134EA_025827 [Puccinia striiformis f. sp. tritici]KAH9451874.1 hypothetical protein Pst134EA_025815 [Puccinia striiformis f. sp. tritici]KAH9451886.1 hypothetical protein Pst134EA_025827 [Puccinia striiformis f. sp. tritici]KAI7941436.1 hypothetical protein MJO29_013510 [Puccinia striiformis f. sp. tritici]
MTISKVSAATCQDDFKTPHCRSFDFGSASKGPDEFTPQSDKDGNFCCPDKYYTECCPDSTSDGPACRPADG